MTARLELAIEASPTGMFMTDGAGIIVLVNAQLERLFGYSRQELLGRSIEVLVPARFRAGHSALTAAFLANPQPRSMGAGRDLWGLCKDGREVPIEIGLNPVRTPEGDFVLGSVVDISARRQLERTLREREDLTERARAGEQFRLAIEAAPTAMIVTDRQGRIMQVNTQVERLFGYPRQELLGQPVELLVPERFRADHGRHRQTFVAHPQTRLMGAGRDLFGLRKDGTEVPIEIGLNPFQAADGELVLSSVVDISERKRAEREREDLLAQLHALNSDLEERVRARTAELRATLKEREVLLQEVHHRVKNNLQVVSSLINMQMRKLAAGADRGALAECKTRVEAIALIHEKLYQSRDYAQVPFSEYAASLANSIFHTLGVAPDTVSLALAIEPLSLSVDQAIPCGLIINELITNALKHGFPDGRAGVVRVELGAHGTRELVLAVSDDGVGMPGAVDPRTSRSLGLQLVTTLVEQLGGQLELVRDAGTRLRVTFPARAASVAPAPARR